MENKEKLIVALRASLLRHKGNFGAAVQEVRQEQPDLLAAITGRASEPSEDSPLVRAVLRAGGSR